MLQFLTKLFLNEKKINLNQLQCCQAICCTCILFIALLAIFIVSYVVLLFSPILFTYLKDYIPIGEIFGQVGYYKLTMDAFDTNLSKLEFLFALFFRKNSKLTSFKKNHTVSYLHMRFWPQFHWINHIMPCNSSFLQLFGSWLSSTSSVPCFIFLFPHKHKMSNSFQNYQILSRLDHFLSFRRLRIIFTPHLLLDCLLQKAKEN